MERLYVAQENPDLPFYFQKYAISNKFHNNHYKATAPILHSEKKISFIKCFWFWH